jgi:hypothetical protein
VVGRKPVPQLTAPPRGPRGPGLQHHKPGQVVGFAAQPVGDPCAQARAAELAGTCVHEQLGRRVIEQVRGAGSNKRDVIHDPGGVRKEVGDPGSAATMAGERALRSKQVRAMACPHEGKALAGDQGGGNGLTVQRLQPWFVVKQVELARAAGHEEVDNPLGSRLEMRRLGSEGLRRRSGGAAQRLFAEQRGEGDPSESDGAATEEVAPRDVGDVLRRIEGDGGRHDQARVMVSSRLSSTRATATQASSGVAAGSPVPGCCSVRNRSSSRSRSAAAGGRERQS